MRIGDITAINESPELIAKFVAFCNELVAAYDKMSRAEIQTFVKTLFVSSKTFFHKNDGTNNVFTDLRISEGLTDGMMVLYTQKKHQSIGQTFRNTNIIKKHICINISS